MARQDRELASGRRQRLQGVLDGEWFKLRPELARVETIYIPSEEEPEHPVLSEEL
jgi:hypothetical protein